MFTSETPSDRAMAAAAQEFGVSRQAVGAACRRLKTEDGRVRVVVFCHPDDAAAIKSMARELGDARSHNLGARP